jgi:hypothetical protein
MSSRILTFSGFCVVLLNNSYTKTKKQTAGGVDANAIGGGTRASRIMTTGQIYVQENGRQFQDVPWALVSLYILCSTKYRAQSFLLANSLKLPHI